MKQKHLDLESYKSLLSDLNASEDPRAILFYILAVTGIRADELTTSRFRDVDLERGIITVKASKGSHNRSLGLPPKLTQKLDAFLKQNACMELAEYSLMYLVSNRYHDAHKIKSKRHASKQALREYWREIRPKYDNRISLHGLRHSVAVHGLKGGLQLNEVKAILGHKSLASTEHYLSYVDSLEAQSKVLKILEAS